MTEVDAASVVRLIEQFLAENGFERSLATLQDEAQVALNSVASTDALREDVLAGNWDAVLRACAPLRLPLGVSMDLYEHAYLELLEARERDTATLLLRTAKAFAKMKYAASERYVVLEHMLTQTRFDPETASPGGREKRRGEIAAALLEHVSVVPPSRLLTLLGQSLKWQRQQGLVDEGDTVDLFQGRRATRREEEDRVVGHLSHTFKFGKTAHAECAAFSPDEQYLASGSADGFIEIWDYVTGSLRKDLQYQANDKLMMHSDAVTCLCFSPDSTLLASGSKDGAVKVWTVLTGKTVMRIKGAHTAGVTSVRFAPDGKHVISTGFDHLLRLHGLTSGQTIREFKGHSSAVQCAMFFADGRRIASAGADGTVRVWETKTGAQLSLFKPPSPSALADVVVSGLEPVAGEPNAALVLTRSTAAHLIELETGAVVREFVTDTPEASGDFAACAVAPRGALVYLAAANHLLYCFEVATGKLVQQNKVHDRDVVGLAHHPSRNVLATFALDGRMKLWRV